jgi:DNA replication protein DnaC
MVGKMALTEFHKKFINTVRHERPSSTLPLILAAGSNVDLELVDAVANFICKELTSFEKLTTFQGQIKDFTIGRFTEVKDIMIRMESESEKAERVKIEQEEKAKKDAEDQKQIAYWEAKRKKDEINNMIVDSHIPQITMHTHRFDTFKTAKGTENAFKMCREFADETGTNWHPFLTLAGVNGTGKTHLAISIGWHFILERQKSVIYFQSERLFKTVRDSFNKQNSQDVIKQCEEVNLLIIDDLAAEKKSPWVDSTLDALVDFRYINGLPTVFTTNAAPQDLDRRIASRLAEGNFLILNGEDYRKVKSTQRSYGTADVSPRYSDIKIIKKKPDYGGFSTIGDDDNNDGMEGLKSI